MKELEAPWKFRRWGIQLGPLAITWKNMWSGSHGLEVIWGDHRSLVRLGFRDA